MFKRIVKRVICVTVVAAMLAPSFCVEANAEQLEMQGIALQEDEENAEILVELSDDILEETSAEISEENQEDI